MPFSTDIRLPRRAAAVFPDRCVACGKERPGDHIALTVRASGLWDLFLPWIYFTRKPVRCQAPACPPCRDAAVWQRRVRFGALIIMIAVAIAFVRPWVKSWGLSRGSTRLLTLAISIVPLVPWILWLVVRPPPIDLTVHRDTVEYEFADAAYAKEFAQRNAGERRC
jgi:hypothetical protein